MSERRKKNYENALTEIIVINEHDVIATSGFDNFVHVDKDENSWVTPDNGSEWN